MHPGTKEILEDDDLDLDRKHKKHKHSKTKLTTWEGLLLLLVLKEKGLLDELFQEAISDSYYEDYKEPTNQKANKKSEDHYDEVDSLQDFIDSQQNDHWKTRKKRRKEYYDFDYILED